MKQTIRWLLRDEAGFYLLFSTLFVFVVIIFLGFAHRFAFITTPTLLTLSSILWAISLCLFITALSVIVLFYQVGFQHLNMKVIQAAMVSLVIVVMPAYILWTSRNLPLINDVSTDINDPPRFDVVKTLRSDKANDTAYTSKASVLNQSYYYLDIHSIIIDKPPKVLFPIILDLVHDRAWIILDTILPAGSGTEGKIEATSFTPWLRFSDDIVIRIRRQGKNSRVDVRSASRYGVYDFGANAERVRSFLIELKAIN